MTGPDEATRADRWWYRVTGRALWWRVIDAEFAYPPRNDREAVRSLYETKPAKGAKR